MPMASLTVREGMLSLAVPNSLPRGKTLVLVLLSSAPDALSKILISARACSIDLSFRIRRVASSAYPDILVGVGQPGMGIPVIRGLDLIFSARVSATKMYKRAERGHP